MRERIFDRGAYRKVRLLRQHDDGREAAPVGDGNGELGDAGLGKHRGDGARERDMRRTVPVLYRSLGT